MELESNFKGDEQLEPVAFYETKGYLYVLDNKFASDISFSQQIDLVSYR